MRKPDKDGTYLSHPSWEWNPGLLLWFIRLALAVLNQVRYNSTTARQIFNKLLPDLIIKVVRNERN